MIYLMIVIYFDKEMMKMSEQIGFSKKLSRAYKFYLLFFVMALFLVAAVLISGM